MSGIGRLIAFKTNDGRRLDVQRRVDGFMLDIADDPRERWAAIILDDSMAQIFAEWIMRRLAPEGEA